MLSLNAPEETTATDWCCQSEHGVMHRDLRGACIKKCRLFRSLYCWMSSNCIYLMPLQQMPNTERGKALRMSRKANKKYSKVAG